MEAFLMFVNYMKRKWDEGSIIIDLTVRKLERNVVTGKAILEQFTD